MILTRGAQITMVDKLVRNAKVPRDTLVPIPCQCPESLSKKARRRGKAAKPAGRHGYHLVRLERLDKGGDLRGKVQYRDIEVENPDALFAHGADQGG